MTRLNARSAGLLEYAIPERGVHTAMVGTPNFVECDCNNQSRPVTYFKIEVSFIHRTVFEFLFEQTDGKLLWQTQSSWTARQNATAIACSYGARLTEGDTEFDYYQIADTLDRIAREDSEVGPVHALMVACLGQIEQKLRDTSLYPND